VLRITHPLLDDRALPDFWRVPDFRQRWQAPDRAIAPEFWRRARAHQRCRTSWPQAVQLRCLSSRAPAGTTFALRRSMRRHHEAATSAIVAALAMAIPVAGGLWARWTSLQRPPAKPVKPAEGSHEQEA
jgi:hypothetical protein